MTQRRLPEILNQYPEELQFKVVNESVFSISAEEPKGKGCSADAGEDDGITDGHAVSGISAGKFLRTGNKR